MQPGFELVLIQWADSNGFDGPRLLGRLRDPDLLTEVQDRLAASHLRQLAAIKPPVQIVPQPKPERSA